MRIGYAKFSMNLEIDFSSARIGNAESRITLFRAIIQSGWDLTIYTQLSRIDEKNLHYSFFENEFGIPMKWTKKIKYEPEKLVDKNTDLLIIESGPDNWMFKTRYNDNEPFIRRCANLLNSYSGVVFFFNNDPDLCFPLHKMAFCKIPYDHPKNKHRLGTGSDPEHGWATYDEVFKNKKLVFLNQAHDQKRFLEKFDRGRCKYREHGAKCYMLPIAYDPKLIPRQIRSDLRLNRKPKHGFIYIGYPRRRESEFRNFYLNTRIKKIDVWGPWDKKAFKKFSSEVDEDNRVTKHGFLKCFALCAMTYHDSLFTITLSSAKSRYAGAVTHRSLESIRSGCITLAIRDYIAIDKYIDEEFLVSSPKDVERWYRKLSLMNYKQRFALLEKQFNKIEKYNGHYFLRKIMKIFQKEK